LSELSWSSENEWMKDGDTDVWSETEILLKWKWNCPCCGWVSSQLRLPFVSVFLSLLFLFVFVGPF
jgi:hypothetical protein